MAADSSMGFHQGIIPSFYNQHMVSFQSGAMNNNFRGIGGSDTVGTNSNAGLFFSPNSPSNLIGNMPGSTIGQVGSTSSNPFGAPVPKFKFVTVTPDDWSAGELAILKEGLVRYAHEPTIMKYIKIAAMLPTKTIRDVALRCWYTSKEGNKRRKPEDHYTGKKMRDMKEKMTASTSNGNMVSLNELAPFPLLMHPSNQNCAYPTCEGPVLDSATQNLIEENNTLLHQIAANIETSKLQENPDLFVRMSNNIVTIFNRIGVEMPGLFGGQMAPFPVSINEENLNAVFQLNRMISFGGQSILHMKQEPRS
ncbi:hypothetical protein LUZ63_011232 [Rhynchospora breviuscula]|uniref:Uncharacterized protein n=1 Tax=Rhynchospora breviuscula TaxID=2022672 RepID=A0A9Q0CJE7_9POAL|nr:hypothetical protein LUZ63_011232 [Rhynchospora breviuscula]